MAIHTSALLQSPPTYTPKQLKELCSSSQSFIRSDCLVASHPTTAPHPQLLDLLICPRQGRVASLNGNSIIGLDFATGRSDRLFSLPFNANCLVQGHGLIVSGGQNSQLAVRSWSDERRTDWSTANYSVGGSINNSVHICPLPGSSRTATRPGATDSQDPLARLLVSNNDASIVIFDVYQPTSSSSSMSNEMDLDEAANRQELQNRPVLRKQRAISMSTAINHSSVSPDGRFMVAVGDTNDAFFFACPTRPRDPYVLVQVTKVASDGGFSTDWSRDSQTCAVASQDGVVSIFDIRSLKRSTSQGSAKTVARFNTIASDNYYAGRTGTQSKAARVVKYSPGSGSELLAFTEQRSCAQIVDARSYDSFSSQVLHLPQADGSRRDTNRLPSIGSPAGRSLLSALAQAGDRSSALTYAAHMFQSGTASYADIFPPVENLFGEEEAMAFASPDWMPPSHPPLSHDHARFLVSSNDNRPGALPSLSAFLDGAEDTRAPTRREVSPALPELGTDGRLRFGSLGNATAGAHRPTETHLPYCGLEDAMKATPSGVELRGLAWSPEGDKLYIAGEQSCAEFSVDVNARNSWPCRSIV